MQEDEDKEEEGGEGGGEQHLVMAAIPSMTVLKYSSPKFGFNL